MEDLSAFLTQPSTLIQNLNFVNEMRASNKPPKLLKLKDYPSLDDKFETHVQAGSYDTWIAVEEEYILHINENGTSYRLSQIREADKAIFLREKKLLNMFQQAIKAKNFQLL